MLESCMRPELVVEITLQPVRRYGVDAAIFFSDIVLPLKAVGVDLDIKPGVGPVVAAPVRTLADVEAIPDLDARARRRSSPRRCAAWSAELGRHAADRLRRRAVHGGVVPRRGRAVEGAREDQGDDVRRPRRVGRADAQDRRRSPATYLEVQVAAGASAVQLFDSWAGALTPADYERHVHAALRAVLAAAGELGVPRIHFGVGTGEPARADGRGRRRRGRRRLAHAARRRDPAVGDRAVQGNLDPTLVFAPDRGDDRPGRPRSSRPAAPPRATSSTSATA